MAYNYFCEPTCMVIDFLIEQRWFRMKIFKQSLDFEAHDNPYDFNLHFLTYIPTDKQNIKNILYQEYMKKIGSNHPRWIKKKFTIVVNAITRYHRQIIVTATGV